MLLGFAAATLLLVAAGFLVLRFGVAAVPLGPTLAAALSETVGSPDQDPADGPAPEATPEPAVSITHGVASGEVTATSAVLWARMLGQGDLARIVQHPRTSQVRPNSLRQKPLRFGAGGGTCCWTGSGLTSIQPWRMSSFAFELEIVSSFPVSMFRTVRNRTWFIEAPPGYDSPAHRTMSPRPRPRLGCGKESARPHR